MMEEFQYHLLARVEARHWWHRVLRITIDRALQRYLPPRELRILDAGCGTGALLRHLGQRHDITGVDVAPAALAYCRGRGAGPLAFADTQRLPFRDAAFDAVISIDVLSQNSVPSETHALAEMHRVLRPDGILLLQLSAFHRLAGEHDRTIRQRRYERSEVEHLVLASGLRPIALRYRLAFLPPLMLINNALTSWRGGQDKPDLSLPSSPVNALFYLLASAERVAGVPPPWGSSLFCVARR